jgi:hypothetical protein
MTITNSARLFQPLSGLELRKILIDDFTKMLDESGYFMEHLSFSLADVDIRATITSNPPLFNDIELAVKRRLETDDANSLTSEAKTVNLSKSLARVGEVPDADREAHGLHTTEVRRDETTGVLFDQPVEPREVKNQTTVGAGTRPRGTAIPAEKMRRAAQGSAELERVPPSKIDGGYDPILDDEGNEIKING